MKILTALPLAATLSASLLAPGAARAHDEIDPARAKAFDNRIFAGPIAETASACFVRIYDARHLTQHAKQTVSAMKLLVTAQNKPNEPTSYAYKVGVRFRNKPGNFDGGSSCGHFAGDEGNREIRFSCDVDCGGGGLEIAMSKDSKSAIVHLEVIGLWDRKHPDRDAVTLEGGVDDRVFRVDRVDNGECDELLTGREAQASRQQE